MHPLRVDEVVGNDSSIAFSAQSPMGQQQLPTPPSWLLFFPCDDWAFAFKIIW